MEGYAGNADYLREMEFRDQEAKDAEAIRRLTIEPTKKHTREHYEWFKRNYGHLISFPPGHQTSELDISNVYLKYHPLPSAGGRRMRYKSTRRRGKTNRRRVKTHRRRHRKH